MAPSDSHSQLEMLSRKIFSPTDNHKIILFIAVLDRSCTLEYVEIFNYEKTPNIDQDIRKTAECRRVPGVPNMAPEKRQIRQ